MNPFMTCVRCLCGKRVPKSTYTDYYFDPKVVLFGTPVFDPKKVQNKISEQEFPKMREAMIREGGNWLIAAKILFVLVLIYSIVGAVAGILSISKVFDMFFGTQALIFMMPSIILQMIWIFCGWKARNKIRDLFDWQNERYYTARGVNWLTCGTLLFIHVKITEKDAELQEFKEYSNNSVLLMGTSGNNMSAFETINKNSNREILLKNHQIQGSGLIQKGL